MSTVPIVRTSESRAVSIQRFIESSPASFASGHCSRTSRWRSGWMFARNRTSAVARRPRRAWARTRRTRSAACRACGGCSGSTRTRPSRRRSGRPPRCSMSSVFTPRSRSTAYSSSPKSSPTGPTTRTSVKKLAASEKCTAEPPSMRSRSPKGVLTASKAIDPTTTRLMRPESLATTSGRARAGR